MLKKTVTRRIPPNLGLDASGVLRDKVLKTLPLGMETPYVLAVRGICTIDVWIFEHQLPIFNAWANSLEI
jgi:hypothetical protein